MSVTGKEPGTVNNTPSFSGFESVPDEVEIQEVRESATVAVKSRLSHRIKLEANEQHFSTEHVEMEISDPQDGLKDAINDHETLPIKPRQLFPSTDTQADILPKEEVGLSTSEATTNSTPFKKFSTVGSFAEYFADDESDTLSKEKQKNIYFYYESEVNFSVSQYLEFFLYHVLYFLFLGPFICILTLFSKRLRIVFYNMQFNKLNGSGLSQGSFWLISVTVVIGFLTGVCGRPMFEVTDSVLVKTVIIGVIFRTTSIAGKYATYPKALIKKVKEVLLSDNELTAEFMLGAWKQQPPEIRFAEITNAIERIEIDRSLLRMSFMSNVSVRASQGLQKIAQERQEGIDYSQEVQLASQKLTQVYHGEYLLEYLIKHFHEQSGTPRCDVVASVILTGIWSLSQILVRGFVGEKVFGKNVLEVSIQVMVLLIDGMLFFIQYLFYRQAAIDVQRKVFLMRQLGSMMTPRNTGAKWVKLLPTLSLADQLSLRCWLQLRRISLDYGRKYFYRHEIFLPVTLTLLAIYLLGLAAFQYTFKSDLSPFLKTELTKLYYSMFLDVISLIASGFHFIYLAGSLNDEFKHHIGVLEMNRLYFKDILEIRGIYFPQDLNFGHGCATRTVARQLELKSSNFLRRKLVREVLSLVEDSESNQEEKIVCILESIIRTFDDLLEGLRHDEAFNHVTILGWTVTRANAVNGLLALLSFIFAGYQLITSR